jgi:hypothetical protein
MGVFHQGEKVESQVVLQSIKIGRYGVALSVPQWKRFLPNSNVA